MHLRLWDKIWHQWLGRPYRLNYVTYGSGEEPLLLLHGLASSHIVWRHVIRLLKNDYTIIAPDLLGFGASPTPQWSSYDIKQHTKHIVALLRRFKIDQPVTIVGHSMGCLIASHIAHAHPELVKRIVLYEPPLFADVPNETMHARLRAGYFGIFKYVATHPELVFKNGQLRSVYTRITGISLRPDTWVPFQRSIHNTILEQTAYDELHAITVPTMIVHGSLDVIAPKARLHKILDDNPYITFETITTTHGLSLRASRVLAKLLGASSIAK